MYVERIGRQPAPMTADYGDAVESTHAWVAEQGGRLVDLIVLEPAGDHLLLENVAVLPQRRVSAWAADSCNWLRNWPERMACARSICTPTRP